MDWNHDLVSHTAIGEVSHTVTQLLVRICQKVHKNSEESSNND